jgi:hypothetical protein
VVGAAAEEAGRWRGAVEQGRLGAAGGGVAGRWPMEGRPGHAGMLQQGQAGGGLARAAAPTIRVGRRAHAGDERRRRLRRRGAVAAGEGGAAVLVYGGRGKRRRSG